MSSPNAIQIGFNARLFPGIWRPVLEEIAFGAQEAFQAIQFPGPVNGLDSKRLGCSLEEAASALKEARMAAVMEIVVRVTEKGLTAEGHTPLDILHANLEAISILECRFVHWHLVPMFRRLDFSEFEAGFMGQFQAAVAMGKERGFTFGFEHNEPALGLFGTPEACKSMLARVEGLGFVWDLNHTLPEHLAGFLDLTPSMSLLHLSDTPLPAVNHHLPIGSGTIDFSQYFDELIHRGFRGIGILEIGGLPQSGGYGKDTDEALIASRDIVKEVLKGIVREGSPYLSYFFIPFCPHRKQWGAWSSTRPTACIQA